MPTARVLLEKLLNNITIKRWIPPVNTRHPPREAMIRYPFKRIILCWAGINLAYIAMNYFFELKIAI